MYKIFRKNKRKYFVFLYILQSDSTYEMQCNGEKQYKDSNGGAQRMRVKITLACSECKQRNYDTKKNKKNDPDRLEMNKYCRFCRKHTLHKETK